MAFDPVPWFVGGGAEHSPEVARNMLYIATSGAEGITAGEDLKVTSTPTPSGRVRVGTGSGTIVNRGGAQESYSVRAPTVTDVDVAPTGSSGGRTDLVVVRVEDSSAYGTPWPDPKDVRTGPYVFPRVISGVPAGTASVRDLSAALGGQTGAMLALARIDIPANTATITDSMITDLRTVARPATHTETNVNNNATVSTLTSDSWVVWPPYSAGVVVPDWATHAQVRAFLSGIKAVGPVDGEMALGLVIDENNWLINQQAQKYDVDSPAQMILGTSDLSSAAVNAYLTQGWYSKPDDGADVLYSPKTLTGSGGSRFTMILGAYGNVVAGRGKRVYQRIRSHRLQNRPDRGDISVDNGTTIMYDVTFYQRPV